MADQFLKELEGSGLREPSKMRPLVIRWIEELFPRVESITTETLQQWMEDKPGEFLLLDTRSQAEFEVSHLPGAILVPPETDAVKEIFKAWFKQESVFGNIGLSLLPSSWTQAIHYIETFALKMSSSMFSGNGPEAFEWAIEYKKYEGCHRHIVCYCTVGYRSSMTAQLLSDYLSCETSQNFVTSSKIYNVQGGLVKWASERRWMVDQHKKPSSQMHPYNDVWAKLLEPEFKVATEEKV